MRKGIRKKNEKLNILTATAHERFETGLCLTGHNFYAANAPGIKTWNPKYAPVPPNYTILDGNKGDHQAPDDIEFDLVLCHNKFAQYQMLRNIANSLHLPLIHVEHCICSPAWHPNAIQAWRNMEADINVFISDRSIDIWGVSDRPNRKVIYHGIDTTVFSEGPSLSERKIPVLNVCNDIFGRPNEVGTELWMEVSRRTQTVMVGDNGKYSQPAKDIPELVSFYQNAKIFLNTTLVSTYPTSMLEAMACGCVLITTPTGAIPDIIQHGENGLLAGTSQEMLEAIRLIENNPDLAEKLRQNGMKTIRERFGMDRFVNEWNQIFDEAFQLFYKG